MHRFATCLQAALPTSRQKTCLHSNLAPVPAQMYDLQRWAVSRKGGGVQQQQALAAEAIPLQLILCGPHCHSSQAPLAMPHTVLEGQATIPAV